MTGQLPPRNIDLSNLPAGPKFNAWGSCATSEVTGNSCTYVSLKQKYPAYTNYAFSIRLGAQQYTDLGQKLKSVNNITPEVANSMIQKYFSADTGDEIKNALLKMVLFGSLMLTSPNYTGPPFELLIARFYVNEAAFASREIVDALKANDRERAYAAWEFGRDSWNSYFTVVNPSIVPKVGEKFLAIEV